MSKKYIQYLTNFLKLLIFIPSYFHAIFHLFIYYAGAILICIAAYVDALTYHSQHQLNLKFWPIDSLRFGVPYVAIDDKNTG